MGLCLALTCEGSSLSVVGGPRAGQNRRRISAPCHRTGRLGSRRVGP